MIQQNTAPNGILGSPTSNYGNKKSLLKRKNQQQNQMYEQTPPNKQPFMAMAPNSELIHPPFQQHPTPGPMFQMMPQNSASVNTSPQFSSTSPISNHLSPYSK